MDGAPVLIEFFVNPENYRAQALQNLQTYN